MSFFFNAHSDFFEEIAKYRAARRLWAQAMRDRFGARSERSLKLRFHSQTAGVSLTAQQPYNNVVRTALQALSAVLGGTNSLHTNALDEALALPTEAAATLALRTQQVLAHESGLTDEIDPFGGSYFVETLTRQLEDEARAYFAEIDARGGMVAAIEEGFPQREIAESAYRFQRTLEAREKIIVGVNGYLNEQAGSPLETLTIDERATALQRERVAALKQRRDGPRVAEALRRLREAAGSTQNLMPLMIDAVRAHATLGEMCGTLRETWGEYQEQPTI
jgi:methylmalonyl-CoA mutase N-terminal domain/subunit